MEACAVPIMDNCTVDLTRGNRMGEECIKASEIQEKFKRGIAEYLSGISPGEKATLKQSSWFISASSGYGINVHRSYYDSDRSEIANSEDSQHCTPKNLGGQQRH